MRTKQYETALESLAEAEDFALTPAEWDRVYWLYIEAYKGLDNPEKVTEYEELRGKIVF